MVGVSGHAVNLPCSLDLSVCFCYVSRATSYCLLVIMCKDRHLGDDVNLPCVRTPFHLLYSSYRQPIHAA